MLSAASTAAVPQAASATLPPLAPGSAPQLLLRVPSSEGGSADGATGGEVRELARLCASREEEAQRARAEAAQLRDAVRETEKARGLYSHNLQCLNHRFLADTAMRQIVLLKEQIAEFQRGQKRESVDLTSDTSTSQSITLLGASRYLKNIFLKLLESQHLEVCAA